jgi:hypothetical protein
VVSGFDVCYSVSTPQRGFVVTRLLDSYLTHHMDAPSPPTLTTTVFSQGRSGWFEAGPCRQAPAGRFRHRFSSFSCCPVSSLLTEAALLRHTQLL